MNERHGSSGHLSSEARLAQKTESLDRISQSQNLKITMKPIGFIQSCYNEKFGTPRQPHLVPASTAKLKLDSKLNPEQICDGLDGFNYVWLIFLFHENTNKRLQTKIHPPRLGGKPIGVFASRSPHRPNPIGLSLVKLEKVEKGILYFSEVDLIHGTPILDIKPYIPESDSRKKAKSGWVEKVVRKKVPVKWSLSAKTELRNLMRSEIQRKQMTDLIKQTLQQDPRPLVYRKRDSKTAEVSAPSSKSYWVTLSGFNIGFSFENHQFLVTAFKNKRFR